MNSLPTISRRVIDFDAGVLSYPDMNDIPKRVPVFIGRPESHKVSITDDGVCAIAEMTLERSGLYAKLTVYHEKKKLFEELVIKNYLLAPYGFGMCDGRRVKEYNLICLYLEKNEHDTGPTD